MVDKKIIGIFSIFLLFALVGASRLPTVSGDLDAWGTVLNDYLSVSLDASGYIRNASINTTYIALSNVTAGLIAPLAVNTTHIQLSNVTAGLIAPLAVNASHLSTSALNVTSLSVTNLNATNFTAGNFTINRTAGTTLNALQVGTGTCGTAVAFAPAFNSPPSIVMCNTINVTTALGISTCSPGVPTATGFTPLCSFGNGTADLTNKTAWIAIMARLG